MRSIHTHKNNKEYTTPNRELEKRKVGIQKRGPKSDTRDFSFTYPGKVSGNEYDR